MQKNKSNAIVQDNSNINIIAIEKFNTCKFRSKDEIISSSCCSSSKMLAFKCELKNIYPLSSTKHCLSCDKFKYN